MGKLVGRQCYLSFSFDHHFPLYEEICEGEVRLEQFSFGVSAFSPFIYHLENH